MNTINKYILNGTGPQYKNNKSKTLLSGMFCHHSYFLINVFPLIRHSLKCIWFNPNLFLFSHVTKFVVKTNCPSSGDEGQILIIMFDILRHRWEIKEEKSHNISSKPHLDRNFWHFPSVKNCFNSKEAFTTVIDLVTDLFPSILVIYLSGFNAIHF